MFASSWYVVVFLEKNLLSSSPADVSSTNRVEEKTHRFRSLEPLPFFILTSISPSPQPMFTELPKFTAAKRKEILYGAQRKVKMLIQFLSDAVTDELADYWDSCLVEHQTIACLRLRFVVLLCTLGFSREFREGPLRELFTSTKNSALWQRCAKRLPPELARLVKNWPMDKKTMSGEEEAKLTKWEKERASVDQITPALHEALCAPNIGDQVVLLDREDGWRVGGFYQEGFVGTAGRVAMGGILFLLWRVCYEKFHQLWASVDR